MKIEFISYDGEYPNLCRGILKLKIDNEIYTFGEFREYDRTTGKLIPSSTPNSYPSFWVSGGEAGVHFYEDSSESYCYTGSWLFEDNRDLPEIVRQNKEEIMECFNENVRHGCCGGCI